MVTRARKTAAILVKWLKMAKGKPKTTILDIAERSVYISETIVFEGDGFSLEYRRPTSISEVRDIQDRADNWATTARTLATGELRVALGDIPYADMVACFMLSCLEVGDNPASPGDYAILASRNWPLHQAIWDRVKQASIVKIEADAYVGIEAGKKDSNPPSTAPD